MSDDRPSPSALWRQSCLEHAEGSDGQHKRYVELLREHGHLVPRQPGDDGNLPCGWPGNQRR